ncbi:hypothetical protein EON68_01110 [archaeon]|nr:MAG: hypothetical protein EON68_01110 [archaeon]
MAAASAASAAARIFSSSSARARTAAAKAAAKPAPPAKGAKGTSASAAATAAAAVTATGHDAPPPPPGSGSQTPVDGGQSVVEAAAPTLRNLPSVVRSVTLPASLSAAVTQTVLMDEGVFVALRHELAAFRARVYQLLRHAAAHVKRITAVSHSLRVQLAADISRASLVQGAVVEAFVLSARDAIERGAALSSAIALRNARATLTCYVDASQPVCATSVNEFVDAMLRLTRPAMDVARAALCAPLVPPRAYASLDADQPACGSALPLPTFRQIASVCALAARAWALQTSGKAEGAPGMLPAATLCGLLVSLHVCDTRRAAHLCRQHAASSGSGESGADLVHWRRVVLSLACSAHEAAPVQRTGDGSARAALSEEERLEMIAEEEVYNVIMPPLPQPRSVLPLATPTQAWLRDAENSVRGGDAAALPAAVVQELPLWFEPDLSMPAVLASDAWHAGDEKKAEEEAQSAARAQGAGGWHHIAQEHATHAAMQEAQKRTANAMRYRSSLQALANSVDEHVRNDAVAFEEQVRSARALLLDLYKREEATAATASAVYDVAALLSDAAAIAAS